MSKKLPTRWLNFKKWIGDETDDFLFKKYKDEPYTLVEAIQSRYWNIIPYEWRPGHVWYKTKCFCWKRYSTIRAKSLPHTWMDRDTILAHTMFEIFSQFIEEECSPGYVEWYPNDEDGFFGHKIVVGKQWNKDSSDDPDAVWVRDEMQAIYDWWNDAYLPYWNRDGATNEWEVVYKFNEEHQPDVLKPREDGKTYNVFGFENEEDKIEHRRLTKIAQQADKDMEDELNDRLHRILNLRHFMWT